MPTVRRTRLPREDDEATIRALSAAASALQGSVCESNSLNQLSSQAGREQWDDTIDRMIDDILKCNTIYYIPSLLVYALRDQEV